jgi:hypothetical protein
VEAAKMSRKWFVLNGAVQLRAPKAAVLAL